jgi:hypothetical protein
VFHLDDIQRTWQVDLPPAEATVRVADLLRAYGARVTLQDDDFVAAELSRRNVKEAARRAAVMLLPGGIAIAPLVARRGADVVTAEALPSGTGAQVLVTSTGSRAHMLASDIAHGLDVDRRPLAPP